MRRICVFSGNRADYGLLAPLMRQIQDDASLRLKLLVTGAHLSPEFGLTYKLIEKDGYTIDEKVANLLSSDDANGICKSMGMGMILYSEALDRLAPDISVVLGDRFETFAFVAAAMIKRVPVAHIHGGELSFGAWDDAFRHCITKMSHLHFTCAGEYKDRVIQLGEHPDRVFNVGALGVENIQKTTLLKKEVFLTNSGMNAEDNYLLVTFHPATMAGENNITEFQHLLSALDNKKFSSVKIIFTKANADSLGKQINAMAQKYVLKNQSRACLFSSMGQVNYLSAMKHAMAVVGNSSSGILEAPSFKVPVINIGSRQDGRIRAANIIDTPGEASAITDALEKGVSRQFSDSISEMVNPFEKPDTAARIKTVLKETTLKNITSKGFYDLYNERLCSG